MNRWLLLVVGISGFGAACFYASLHLVRAGMHADVVSGALEVLPADLDVGDIAEGATITRSFTVRNLKRERVHVKQILSPCSCTLAELDDRTFAPGEFKQLKISFDSRGYQGRIRKRVVLVPEADEGSPAAASLIANVVHIGMRLDKSTIDLGLVRFGELHTESVSLFGVTPKDMSRVTLISDGAHRISLLEGDFARRSAGDTEIESKLIKVIAGPIFDQVGDHERKVTVGLGSTTFPIIVRYRVVPMIEVEPSALWLEGPSYGGQVRLRWAATATVAISKITSAARVVECKMGERGDGYCKISVSLAGDRARAPTLHDTISVQYWGDTERTRLEEISIPVFLSTPG